MEATLGIAEQERIEATKWWRFFVVSDIGKFDNLDYFSAAEDTPSIVSVRCVHPDTGKWMNKAELAKVFLNMTLDLGDKFPENKEVASRICFSGQPVLINKEEAVLRIALGSDSLREVIQDKKNDTTKTNATDLKMLEKMSFLASKLNEL